MSVIGVGYNPTKRYKVGGKQYTRCGVKEAGRDTFKECEQCSLYHKIPCSTQECLDFNVKKSWYYKEVVCDLTMNIV